MNMKFTTAVILGAFLLPSLAMAQIDTRATFAVTKNFTDNNYRDEAVVSIDCNTGTILDQDKTLGDNDAVEFVVTAYNAVDTMNCSIVENTPTPGYAVSYSGDGVDGSCTWKNIPNPFHGTCTVTNTPKAVDIKVTKKWFIEGDNNDVSLDYSLYLSCTSGEIVSNSYVSRENDSGVVTLPPETFTFQVIPAYETTKCKVEETVYDSAIEVDNRCRSLVVSANKGTACTITNTVFFEGIPTLSQYGMAIMALLMLGVGFVGFRRFV